jgi:hypothetical protein
MRHISVRDGVHHLRERAADRGRVVVVPDEEVDLHVGDGSVLGGEAREDLGDDVDFGKAGAYSLEGEALEFLQTELCIVRSDEGERRKLQGEEYLLGEAVHRLGRAWRRVVWVVSEVLIHHGSARFGHVGLEREELDARLTSANHRNLKDIRRRRRCIDRI